MMELHLSKPGEDGSVLLRLDTFCIEKTARRALAEITTALLCSRDDGDALHPTLSILEDFLRTVDFAALRAKEPRLAGGHPVMVRLRRARSGTVTWEIPDGDATPDSSPDSPATRRG